MSGDRSVGASILVHAYNENEYIIINMYVYVCCLCDLCFKLLKSWSVADIVGQVKMHFVPCYYNGPF